MNKLKEQLINNKIWLQVFGIAFFAMYTIYGLFLNNSFVADNVSAEAIWTIAPPPAHFLYYVAQGRGTTFFHGWLMYALNYGLNVSRLSNSWVITVVMMLFFAASIAIIYSVLAPYFRHRTERVDIILVMLLLVGIINPFFTEMYTFYSIEVANAIFFVALAILRLDSGKYIRSFIWLLIAVCTYQNVYEAYFIWAVLMIMLKVRYKFDKNAFLSYLNAGIVTAASLVVNVASSKVAFFLAGKLGLTGSTVDTTNVTVSKVTGSMAVMGVVTESKKMWIMGFSLIDLIMNLRNGLGAVVKNIVYPSRLFLVLALISCIAILIILLVEKNRFTDVAGTAFALLVMNVTYLTIYLTGSADYSGRLMWPFFVSTAASMILLYNILGDYMVPRNIYRGVLVISCLVLSYFTQKYETDFFMKVALDSQTVGIIRSEIEEYEAESGNEITKISVAYSPSFEYTSKYLLNDYPFESYAYNCKTYYRSWADVNLIILLGDKRYERLIMTDEEFSQRFGDGIWTEFNPSQQLVFEGDTLYWAKY